MDWKRLSTGTEHGKQQWLWTVMADRHCLERHPNERPDRAEVSQSIQFNFVVYTRRVCHPMMMADDDFDDGDDSLVLYSGHTVDYIINFVSTIIVAEIKVKATITTEGGPLAH